MITLSARARLGCAVIAIAAATASPAFAQPGTTPPDASASQGDNNVVVTGSRIRRDPLDQSQPVVFVDRADIDRTGLTSTADVLQRLPGSGGALNSRFNNSGNFGNPPDGGGVGAGAAEVDLRYLGSRRVLVLVDGLRYVNGASASGVPGSVDLNTIPTNMIDRIEVLQAGASALYGSDAIAGVVNVITVQQQEGLRASAQYGEFRHGDGETLFARYHRRPFRHRPRSKDAFHLKTKIEMQPTSVVLVNDESFSNDSHTRATTPEF